MNTATQNKDESHSLDQAKAQLNSIKEMVDNLNGFEAAAIEEGWEAYTDKFNVECWKHKDGSTWAGSAEDLCIEHGIEVQDRHTEEARQTIEEDALSVEVRSDWHTPGSESESSEYTILLCTGGPAVRIIGDLNQHNEPETARIEHQDWFKPWADLPLDSDEEQIVLEYCRCFYFGE